MKPFPPGPGPPLPPDALNERLDFPKRFDRERRRRPEPLRQRARARTLTGT